MAVRLSWLALVAALSFNVAVVMLGSGGRAAEIGAEARGSAAACCTAAH